MLKNFFKTKYRIIKEQNDYYSYYTIQRKYWWWPFWKYIENKYTGLERLLTLEEAEHTVYKYKNGFIKKEIIKEI